MLLILQKSWNADVEKYCVDTATKLRSVGIECLILHDYDDTVLPNWEQKLNVVVDPTYAISADNLNVAYETLRVYKRVKIVKSEDKFIKIFSEKITTRSSGPFHEFVIEYMTEGAI